MKLSVFVTILLVFAAALPATNADDWKVEPKERITNRILFVIDISGSMKNERIRRAKAKVLEMINQETDDTIFGMLTFGGESLCRWPGIPEPDAPKPLPEGWAALPSAEALKAADEWLAGLEADGDTPIAAALHAALQEPMDKLSIVLISDGIFQTIDVGTLISTIRAGQAVRQQQNLKPAVIMAYCVASESGHMETIGNLGGGAYFEGYEAPKVFGPAPAPQPDPVPQGPPLPPPDAVPPQPLPLPPKPTVQNSVR